MWLSGLINLGVGIFCLKIFRRVGFDPQYDPDSEDQLILEFIKFSKFLWIARVHSQENSFSFVRENQWDN